MSQNEETLCLFVSAALLAVLMCLCPSSCATHQMCVPLWLHVCYVSILYWAGAIRDLLINQKLCPNAVVTDRDRERHQQRDMPGEREDQSRGLFPGGPLCA